MAQLAEHYFRTKNSQLAEKLSAKILESDPANSKANELLAYIVGNRGNSSLAFELLARASRDDNCSAEALYYLGTLMLAANRCIEAIGIFERSMTVAGEYFEALHDLATALSHAGRKTQAAP